MHRFVIVVSVLFCSLIVSRIDAQGSAAELIAELQSGDGIRCMNAANATSEYQEHYQAMAVELAAPLFTIVEEGQGCVDSSISALLNLGPGISEGVNAERAIPLLTTIVERGLEPEVAYERVSTAGTAILVIGFFGSDAGAAVPLLQKWIDEAPDYHYRSYGVDSLGRLGDAAAPAIPAMLDFLEPPAADDEQAWEKNELRASVVRMLGLVPAAAQQSAPALVAIMRGGEDSLPYLAAESLTMIGAPAAPHLVAALADGSPELRARVLEILAGMGPAAVAAATEVAPLLADDDWNVAYQAGEVMRQIGATTDGIAALVAVLEGESPDAASSAAEILGAYGSEARDALPALRKAAQSSDWSLSAAAEEAVAAITGEEGS